MGLVETPGLLSLCAMLFHLVILLAVPASARTHAPDVDCAARTPR